MRTFQIPQGRAGISTIGSPPPGQVFQVPFLIPGTSTPVQVPGSDAVSIAQTWTIKSFYLPVALSVGSLGSPPVATFTITAVIAGRPVWSAQGQITPTASSGGFGTGSAGNAILSDDLVNPFELTAGQQIEFNATVSFTVTPLISSLLISAVADTAGGIFGQPGLVNYDVTVDPRIRQPSY